MSLLSPGAYLRTKVNRDSYELRNREGKRFESASAQNVAFLISAGVVFGKLNGAGELEYLVALKPAGIIRKMLNAAMKTGRLTAEDNKTTFMDGKTFAHHMRKSAAFA